MDQRNLVLAIILSVVIILTFQFLSPHRAPPPKPEQSADRVAADATNSAIPVASGAAIAASREAALKLSPRVPIETPSLHGSVSLKGARLDDVTLSDFHETIDPASPAIVLLSPTGAPDAYISEQGWVPVGDTKVPDGDTVWRTEDKALTPKTPLVLTWDNGAGLIFSRTIAVDDKYMFTVTQSVVNHTDAPVTLRPYALISRSGLPPASSTWISFEGPIGAFDGVEEDIKYGAITAGKPVERDTNGGWLGFTDKYWLTSVAPVDQHMALKASFRHFGEGAAQKFQADYLGTETIVAPGQSASAASYVFAGAKLVDLLARYRDDLGLARFDNAIDFGWFWFLTKPIFYLLDAIYGKVGNFGIAILTLTVIIKALFFPLANKAFENMNKMKQLQPEMVKLREKYGEDKLRLNQEMMALQKRIGANPIAGCLPILLQIPVFFSLYKVLFVTIEMRHAPFFGWIHDLSAPDPTSFANGFGLLPFAPPSFLMIGAWPLIYCGTMYVQQRMQPQPADPVQAKMMQFMPIMFTFMMGGFPAGLVIYWSWNNLLGVLQQWLINRRMAAAAAAKAG